MLFPPVPLPAPLPPVALPAVAFVCVVPPAPGFAGAPGGVGAGLPVPPGASAPPGQLPVSSTHA